MFFDRKELQPEIDQIMKLSQHVPNCKIEFAILTNRTEIKKAKLHYGSQWFFDSTLSTIIVQKYSGGTIQIIDINEIIVGLLDLKEVIFENTLPLIDEFTLENYKYYSKRRIPMLNIVIDSIMNP
jgi:hypothetical protein